jgi:outer membrane protein W
MSRSNLGPCTIALILAVSIPIVATAEQGDSEVGIRLLWTTGSATSTGTIAETGSAVTLSSGPGVETGWVLWPLDELSVELSLGLTGHPIKTRGGSLGGLDGGTLWRFPISAVAQYRPKLTDRLDPYVGLGLVFNVLVPRMSSEYEQLLSDLDFTNELDVVAQAGLSYAIDVRWSANLDLRYMGLRTTGTFVALDGSTLDETVFKMNPWVVALGFRFRY